MQRYQAQLDRTKTDFVRYLHDEIRWEARLNAILGARGVGKTTLMFQHILLSGERDISLVVFADDIYFLTLTMIHPSRVRAEASSSINGLSFSCWGVL